MQNRPLNPPILGDFESGSPQIWGARGAKDYSRKKSNHHTFSNANNAPFLGKRCKALLFYNPKISRAKLK
jgi:hypothetical protein